MTEPFEARQSKIVKKKINLLNNRSIRSARLFALPFAGFRRVRPPAWMCRFAGYRRIRRKRRRLSSNDSIEIAPDEITRLNSALSAGQSRDGGKEIALWTGPGPDLWSNWVLAKNGRPSVNSLGD
jgi:hypothetical protein